MSLWIGFRMTVRIAFGMSITIMIAVKTLVRKVVRMSKRIMHWSVTTAVQILTRMSVVHERFRDVG